MSQLAVNGIVIMSSHDIVDLVGSRHGHVKRSIERLAERGIIELPPMGEAKSHLGQSVPICLIGKRDSYIAVTQLSPELAARLADRWQELEQAQQQTIPQLFSGALRLAADLAEQEQWLANELTAAAPKVESVDWYCAASGSVSFRQVAELSRAKEPDLRLFLLESDIMYRPSGTMTPRYQHINTGRFEMKTGTSIISDYAFSQACFTAKGVRWIDGLWAERITREQVA